jgi:hypothetical protein
MSLRRLSIAEGLLGPYHLTLAGQSLAMEVQVPVHGVGTSSLHANNLQFLR